MENILESKMTEKAGYKKFECPDCGSKSSYYLAGVKGHRCKRCGAIFGIEESTRFDGLVGGDREKLQEILRARQTIIQ